MRAFTCLCAISLLSTQVFAAPPVQAPLKEPTVVNGGVVGLQNAVKKRPLHGKFLHITDFHPDRFYKVYTSTAEEAACHRGQGPAGIYGAESSDCDSPVELINQTMKWVEKEVKDKIDFVVWTGDSARHDNDEGLPRNEEQVIALNEFMVHKMFEVFGKNNGDEEDDDPNNDYIVPIIPTFGNNDITPHNIFSQGPNTWTRTYTRIWRSFIPEEQRHQFEQGGWFYVEVIRNKLAVFSLNTLYFFKSNAAVDGCAEPSEPGYEHMEWLRIQLQFMRERGMKAILTGHVPPVRENSKWSWDETCWQKYTLWLRQYRDVIVGNLYGHFNYDNFILQDFEDLRKGTKKGKMPDYPEPRLDEDDVHAALSSSYFTDLRDRWSELPHPPDSLDWPASARSVSGKQTWLELLDGFLSIFKSKKQQRQEEEFLEAIWGEHAERFAASFISASVVPNLYPNFRIFEYNITGLDTKNEINWNVAPLSQEDDLGRPLSDNNDDDDDDEIFKKKYKFVIPKPPSKSSPPGPAYSPQTLSLIRYTQYLANITYINNDFQNASSDVGEHVDPLKWNEGMHKGKTPHDKDHEPEPRKFTFQLHYDTKYDDVYQLPDLTMPSLVNLARRIGDFVPEDEISRRGKKGDDNADVGAIANSKKEKDQLKINKAWWAFVSRAYLGTISPEGLRDEFDS